MEWRLSVEAEQVRIGLRREVCQIDRRSEIPMTLSTQGIGTTYSPETYFHASRKKPGPPLPIRWVRVRDPKRIFKTQAWLCTDLSISAEQLVHGFVRRGQVEVTFHEVRTHLCVETQ